jgi:4-aminobutyrate aminotransferase
MTAVEQQLGAFTHTYHRVLPYENYVRLAERLNEKALGDFDKKTIFQITCAEVVGNAIKIACAATGRPAVIALGGDFHCRTFMGMSLTGKVAPYKAGFGAMMPDVYRRLKSENIIGLGCVSGTVSAEVGGERLDAKNERVFPS